MRELKIPGFSRGQTVVIHPGRTAGYGNYGVYCLLKMLRKNALAFFLYNSRGMAADQFISISRAFSIAAAVGFSPLSILAMVVILSSVESRRILVFTVFPSISLYTK